MDQPLSSYATPINVLLLVIVIYIVFFACNLPSNIYVILNHWFVKLVVLVGIIYSYQYSIQLSILLAIAFLVSLTCNKETLDPVIDTYYSNKVSPNLFSSIPSGSTTDEVPDSSLELISEVNDVKSNKCSDFYPQYEHASKQEKPVDDISVNGFDGGANYSQV